MPKPILSLRVIVRHGLLVVVFSGFVAALLIASGRTPWDQQLVYSQAIGLSIWASIDLGRFALHADPATGWPQGWRGRILVPAGLVAGYIVGTLIGDAYAGSSTWSMQSMKEGRVLVPLLVTLVAGVSGTGFFYLRGRDQYFRAQASASAQALAEAKLKLLESQLEPHMLFNTLANLRVLIAMDPVRAQTMLDRLIGFLRATLVASRGTVHPLGDEFARIDDYLALMKVRMGDRLDTRLVLPPELAQIAVPALLLQPLVENAIKHGLEPHVDGGRIDVTARVAQGMLVLTVRDDGQGLGDGAGQAAGTGFGLEQVRARLETLYGDRASLELRGATGEPDDAADRSDPAGTVPLGGTGTVSVIRIPLSSPDKGVSP